VGIVRERTLAILHAGEMSGKISHQGWVLTTSTPDEFRDLMRSEIVRIGKVLKEAVTEGR
jgi:tripartite-type tricarboxylate transporter receptor subunit TctC